MSKPDQAAVWRRGSLALQTGGKYDIRVDATKHTLVIQDAQLNDHAEYTVVFGDDTSAATVFVEGTSTHSLMWGRGNKYPMFTTEYVFIYPGS